jgi:hypothetical protein
MSRLVVAIILLAGGILVLWVLRELGFVQRKPIFELLLGGNHPTESFSRRLLFVFVVVMVLAIIIFWDSR